MLSANEVVRFLEAVPGLMAVAFHPPSGARLRGGGALGTEIPVFELLAGKVAVDFLGRFLNGEAAGAALLAVRRALMAGGKPTPRTKFLVPHGR